MDQPDSLLPMALQARERAEASGQARTATLLGRIAGMIAAIEARGPGLAPDEEAGAAPALARLRAEARPAA